MKWRELNVRDSEAFYEEYCECRRTGKEWDKCPDDFYDGRVAVSVSLDGFVPLEDDDEIIEPFETIRNIEEL